MKCFISCKALIPERPKGGCFKGSIDYKCTNIHPTSCLPTCLCEEHCAWDRCHLKNPPEKCLLGTNSVWMWDVKNEYWVAQKIKGSIIIILKNHVFSNINYIPNLKKGNVQQ